MDLTAKVKIHTKR